MVNIFILCLLSDLSSVVFTVSKLNFFNFDTRWKTYVDEIQGMCDTFKDLKLTVKAKIQWILC